MNQQHVIIWIVIIVLVAVAVWFTFSDGQEDEQSDSVADFFVKSETAVDEATKIPDANPLGEAKTNPYEDYRNPFTQ